MKVHVGIIKVIRKIVRTKWLYKENINNILTKLVQRYGAGSMMICCNFVKMYDVSFVYFINDFGLETIPILHPFQNIDR